MIAKGSIGKESAWGFRNRGARFPPGEQCHSLKEAPFEQDSQGDIISTFGATTEIRKYPRETAQHPVSLKSYFYISES